jgi:hypothetical protein
MLNAATRTDQTPDASQLRVGRRRQVRLQGRLTWRDTGGVLRFASVVTKDVSELDAFVECQVPASIPLYRLVHFQLERNSYDCADVPPALRHGKILSAVYRVGPYQTATGTPRGYALRLLVDPGAGVASRTGSLPVAMAN